jgi:4-hydroxy-2-oxoheptanedioate aldolase
MTEDTGLAALLGAGAVGGWLALPGSATAELMGSIGFDAVCVDTQHGLIGEDALLPMVQALTATGTPAVVRVSWNSPAAISAALDRGAAAVIVPLVNSADEARTAAAACRYPPRGSRSFGPSRAGWLAAPPEPLCIPMVETVEAVAAAADIAAVDGVDALLVGPSDLAFSAGKLPTAQDGDPAYDELLAAVLAAGLGRGLPVGIYCASPGHVRRFRAMGFSFFFLRAEAAMLADIAAAELAASRPDY